MPPGAFAWLAGDNPQPGRTRVLGPCAAGHFRGKEITMRYICSNCGYIYDPAEGDEVGGIPPGTSFEDLPEDWTCPICYQNKGMFDPLD